MRAIWVVFGGVALAACNSSSSSQWRPISQNEGRFEQAKAICNARAAQTMAAAGRLWIAGAAYSDITFRGCMAEQGFAPKS